MNTKLIKKPIIRVISLIILSFILIISQGAWAKGQYYAGTQNWHQSDCSCEKYCCGK